MTDWLVRLLVKNYRDTEEAQVRTAYGQMAGAVGIACNIALCVAKGLIGLAAGSVSIVADAVNNLSDAASNIVSMLGFKMASRPADPGHPYGHGRYEYLAGLVVSVLVCAVGLELARGGAERIVHPRATELSVPLVAVMLVSIAVKAWMMGFNRVVGERIDSDTLAATAADSRNDALATTGVLVCAVLSRATGVSLDGWVAAALGVFVLVSGAGLVRDTVNPLLGEAPAPELFAAIQRKILQAPGVLGTHDIMVHDYGPGRKIGSAHVVMPARMDPIEAHHVLDGLEKGILAQDGVQMTLHWDPVRTDAGPWDGDDPDE